ncbi:MAG: hypothetical protein LUC25_01355 [Ruminococcus sp.]|nr:hypothetical protein [Ruminococcus sp.]
MNFFRKLAMQVSLIAFSFYMFSFSVGAYSSSDSGGSSSYYFFAAVVGGIIVALIVASTLVSMSRTKHKSTQADHYISSPVTISGKQDRFIRRETRRIDKR